MKETTCLASIGAIGIAGIIFVGLTCKDKAVDNPYVNLNDLGVTTNGVYTTNYYEIHHVLARTEVVLVTNVTERWPMHREVVPNPPGEELYAIAYTKEVPDKDPTNKWVKTSVVRQTFVEFTVLNTPFRGLLKQETVSDHEVEYILKREEQWLEKPKQ